MGGFCQGKGCPVPENLAAYREGRDGGGYFSDARTREHACALIELISLDGVCLSGPDTVTVDDSGSEVLRECMHPKKWVMDDLANALVEPGDEIELITKIEKKA